MKKKNPNGPGIQQQQMGQTAREQQQRYGQIGEDERMYRNQQLQTVNDTTNQAKTALEQTNPILNRLTQLNEAGTTPWRQAYGNTLSSATAQAGENALARTRERGAAAGYGFGSPTQFGAEATLANEQAGRIAQIPGQVELAATPLEMEAVQQQANMQNQRGALYNALAGTQLGVANQFEPLGYAQLGKGYFDTGADIEQQRQLAEERAKARKGALIKGLAKLGLSAAAPFTGGATGLAGSAAGAL